MQVECPDCKGTGVIDPCPRCRGIGKIEHDCKSYTTLELVANIFGCTHQRYGAMGSYNRLGIYRCKTCNQLWKIRFQYDPGTGSDHIWLRPGMSDRGYEFPEEDSKLFVQILNAKSVAELPGGLSNRDTYIREFAEKRFQELSSRELNVNMGEESI